MSEPIPVTVDNFARAESDTMFDRVAADGGAQGSWMINRQPAPLDHQPIIRLNRDTLYSATIADVTQGANITIPDAGGRYLSVMIVNQDHFIPVVFHDPGVHELTREQAGTDFVIVGVRILVDPDDPDDVAEVNRLQDLVQIQTRSNEPFTHPEWDATTHQQVRQAVLELARFASGFGGAFGTREQTDTLHHLLGAAAGWGGLPETEAMYLNVEPNLPPGDYSLTVGEVPVDAFWSISVYNRDGYFEPNERGVTSVNSVTAERNDDGSVTVRFGDGDAPNTIPTPDGWNYLVRLYRPRPEVVSGEWTFPGLDGRA